MSIGINLRDEEDPPKDDLDNWKHDMFDADVPKEWVMDDYEYQSQELISISKVKFGWKPSLSKKGSWNPYFTIGVQTFSLAPVETEERANWYIDMLKKAFSKLTI